MKSLITLLLLLLSTAGLTLQAQDNKKNTSKESLAILYPKNKQKVRGEYQISGKAKPGVVVKVQLRSSYYKKVYDSKERMVKGEGPIDRINRSYTVTADRAGRWKLKSEALYNAGWEETYTIKATAEGKTVQLQVYDNTLPVRID